MRTPFQCAIKLLFAFGMGSFASLAAAGMPGAIITYGPAGTSVPTISGPMLIALAVLLMLVAFRLLKDRPASGTNLVIVLTALSALAIGSGGIKLVADAEAVDVFELKMTKEGGGTLNVEPGEWQVSNSTAVPQQIKNIEFSEGCKQAVLAGFEADSCSPGSTLAPKNIEYCEISVRCQIGNGAGNGAVPI